MKRTYQVWYSIAFEVAVNVDDPDDEVSDEEILERVEPLLPHHRVSYCELESIEPVGEDFYG